MNELEKCMAGQYYNCHDKIFLEFKKTLLWPMTKSRRKQRF